MNSYCSCTDMGCKSWLLESIDKLVVQQNFVATEFRYTIGVQPDPALTARVPQPCDLHTQGNHCTEKQAVYLDSSAVCCKSLS